MRKLLILALFALAILTAIAFRFGATAFFLANTSFFLALLIANQFFGLGVPRPRTTPAPVTPVITPGAAGPSPAAPTPIGTTPSVPVINVYPAAPVLSPIFGYLGFATLGVVFVLVAPPSVWSNAKEMFNSYIKAISQQNQSQTQATTPSLQITNNIEGPKNDNKSSGTANINGSGNAENGSSNTSQTAILKTGDSNGSQTNSNQSDGKKQSGGSGANDQATNEAIPGQGQANRTGDKGKINNGNNSNAQPSLPVLACVMREGWIENADGHCSSLIAAQLTGKEWTLSSLPSGQTIKGGQNSESDRLGDLERLGRRTLKNFAKVRVLVLGAKAFTVLAESATPKLELDNETAFDGQIGNQTWKYPATRLVLTGETLAAYIAPGTNETEADRTARTNRLMQVLTEIQRQWPAVDILKLVLSIRPYVKTDGIDLDWVKEMIDLNAPASINP
jgi:hypothetical protein